MNHFNREGRGLSGGVAKSDPKSTTSSQSSNCTGNMTEDTVNDECICKWLTSGCIVHYRPNEEPKQTLSGESGWPTSVGMENNTLDNSSHGGMSRDTAISDYVPNLDDNRCRMIPMPGNWVTRQQLAIQWQMQTATVNQSVPWSGYTPMRIAHNFDMAHTFAKKNGISHKAEDYRIGVLCMPRPGKYRKEF